MPIVYSGEFVIMNLHTINHYEAVRLCIVIAQCCVCACQHLLLSSPL